jgi:hypothetical protein
MLMLTPVVGSGERGRWTVSAGRGLILASVPGCAAINDARWLWCHAQITQLHGDKLGIDMNGVQPSVGVETKCLLRAVVDLRANTEPHCQLAFVFISESSEVSFPGVGC